MRKSCLIYGHNGLDLDVAFNVKEFYKGLGFNTVFSDKICQANLLVIVRGTNKELDLSGYNYDQIHIFDYVGSEYDKLINSVDHNITYIFSTSSQSKEYIVNNLGFPMENIFISLPPIETSLWDTKPKKAKYKFVHVGNFKKIEEKDSIRDMFHDCIPKLNTDVWGMNWSLSQKDKYHGKAGLFEVSSIYAESNYALGLMYPFQRNTTFSGRFWHAPLNGCYLFSEKGLYTSYGIPGVIETDYTHEDILSKIDNLGTREALQQESITFWKKENLKTKQIVLKLIDKFKTSPSKRIGNKKLYINNELKFYYQKMKLFKLLKL